jgi:gas vesicle protein
MENLIQKLQNEAGLTEEQALKAVTVVKEYMDDEGMSIDWNKFFKGKYNEFLERSESLVNKMSRKVDDFSDKVSDKIEDMSIDAKRAVRDFSKKVYDKLDEEVKE